MRRFSDLTEQETHETVELLLLLRFQRELGRYSGLNIPPQQWSAAPLKKVRGKASIYAVPKS